MKVLGIDPGCYGALAVYDDTLPEKDHWYVEPLPITETRKGRPDLDLKALFKLLSAFRDASGCLEFNLVVVENPPTVPGNGVLAYRSLFKGFGEIRGILTALSVKGLAQPSPQEWKKVILTGTKKDKLAAIAYVKQRFPQIVIPVHPKPKKKGDLHDGIADAVCLAEYGRRQLGETFTLRNLQ